MVGPPRHHSECRPTLAALLNSSRCSQSMAARAVIDSIVTWSTCVGRYALMTPTIAAVSPVVAAALSCMATVVASDATRHFRIIRCSAGPRVLVHTDIKASGVVGLGASGVRGSASESDRGRGVGPAVAGWVASRRSRSGSLVAVWDCMVDGCAVVSGVAAGLCCANGLGGGLGVVAGVVAVAGWRVSASLTRLPRVLTGDLPGTVGGSLVGVTVGRGTAAGGVWLVGGVNGLEPGPDVPAVLRSMAFPALAMAGPGVLGGGGC